MIARDLLTSEDVRRLVDYDPETGSFHWRSPVSRKCKPGHPTGNLDSKGYIRLGLMNRQYRAHRIAWLHYYGEWPNGEIDHANLDRTDNRICNLRIASGSDNLANRRRNKNNTSGCKGVTKASIGKPYRAYITKDRKTRHLGSFDTLEEAAEAYRKAAVEQFGEFARLALRP